MSNMLTRMILVLVVLFAMATCSHSLAEQSVRHSYNGVWVDSAQYNEGYRTRSPFSSREFLWHQVVLQYNTDTSWLFGFSDGLEYLDSSMSGDTIILKCAENGGCLLRLLVLDDSTMSCGDCVMDSNLILRKLPSVPHDRQDPLVWLFSERFFIGEKTISVPGKIIPRSKAVFRSDETVSGLAEWIGYGIGIGGSEGLPDCDILSVLTIDSKRLCYSYVVDADSILVYQIKRKGANDSEQTMPCDSLDIEDVPGRLLYIIANDEKVKPTRLRNSAPDLHGKSK